jgi:hypothetical protein
MHFRRRPVPSTLKLIEDAPLERLRTGTRAVVEVVAYPDGQVRLTASSISGKPGARVVTQGPFLMFVDADEAKDALDALADRLARVAAVD